MPRLKHKTSALSTQNLTSPLDDINKKVNKIGKKNNDQRGALRIEIREMDEHSARGQLYYLLTLKIITSGWPVPKCGPLVVSKTLDQFVMLKYFAM